LAEVFKAPTYPRMGEPGRLFLNLSEHGRLQAIALARAKIRQRTSAVLGPCILWHACDSAAATLMLVLRFDLGEPESHERTASALR
jgi:hypothetical protein